MNESAESLIAYCSENRRLCPLPQQWDKLWRAVPNQAQEDWLLYPDWPGFPMPGILRAIRLAEHIRWAAEHGALEKVAAFLRGLREDEWFHSGD